MKMRNLTCKEVLQHLVEYLEQELAPELHQAIQSHIEKCPFCQRLVESYKRTIALFKKANHIEPPKGSKERLKKRIIDQLAKQTDV